MVLHGKPCNLTFSGGGLKATSTTSSNTRGEFIAIHPEKEVVFHHKEDEVFGKWLESLPQEEADQLLPTHADKNRGGYGLRPGS